MRRNFLRKNRTRGCGCARPRQAAWKLFRVCHPIVLRNFQSPGDIVMLTAAVRDLHLQYPGRFRTDVRTSAPAIWEHNPYITSLDPRLAQTIDCQYPLIHRSNQEPWHFIHGFHQFLSAQLRITLRPLRFRGDIHLADPEKSWMSQVEEVIGADLPFWIIVAGGKADFTAKLWSRERFQQVVDHFRGRIAFVQVGETGHEHPPLRGVIDLRFRTDLRQLIRLVYHAAGVLCPVTLAMHLAAAVETRPDRPSNRPCVVIAGGRESPSWEAYPHHQYLHRVGSLRCCQEGGCWKARAVPLGDGDEKDAPQNLCVDVVGRIPHCMELIATEDVTRAIEIYHAGGSCRFLEPQQWRRVEPHLSESPRAVRRLEAAAATR